MKLSVSFVSIYFSFFQVSINAGNAGVDTNVMIILDIKNALFEM